MPRRIQLLSSAPNERLGDRLRTELQSGRWSRLSAGVAYVKLSGVRQIAHELFAFARSGDVRMTVGIDQQGSSLEGVQTLWQVLGSPPDGLFILNNPTTNPPTTFHPKVWVFESDREALALVGSGNLTAGGLFTNVEFGTAIELDLSSTLDQALHAAAIGELSMWADDSRSDVVAVSPAVLQQMHSSGELPSEAAIRSAGVIARTTRAAVAGVARGARATSGLFGIRPVVAAPPAPALPVLPTPPVTPAPPVRLGGGGRRSSARPAPGSPIPPVVPIHDELLIQVNPRQKTEIFLAKRLLQEDPAFFGWPFLGLTTPKRRGNPGQPQPDPLPTASVVVFGTTGQVLGRVLDDSLKLWTYSIGPSANDDFRLTLTGGLQHMVPDGSIMRMRRQPASGRDYEIEIYPPGHPQYASLLAQCTETLPGGRRYGWA